MSGALSDLRVIDLSTEVAGPFCGRLLADFGADVIKVEPAAGDPGRDLPPLLDDAPGGERSGFFAYLNSNKRGIALDLERERGRELLRRLAARADVVIESFPPGYLDALGLGFDALEAVRPGLILTSITPFGQTGPWRDRQSNDLTAYAISGWSSINGTPEGPPLKGSGYQASYLGGLDAFLGTLAALSYRDRHGVGQHVDVSVLEALETTFAPRLLQYQHSGLDGRRERPDFIRGPVPVKDGYFALTLSRAHFWRDAMNELGLPELAESTRFWDRTQPQQREELTSRVEPKLRERGKFELFERLAMLRVVCGMVLTTEELFKNSHVRERGFFVEAEQPGLGKVEMPGASFKMSATPWELRRPAPRLGEHTDAVLAELLALSDDDLRALRTEGVIG